MPPVAHCLVADIYAVHVQHVLDIPEQEREAKENLHRQTDNLGEGLEVALGGRLGYAEKPHRPTVGSCLCPLARARETTKCFGPGIE